MSRETLLDQLGKLRRFILVGLIAAGVDIGGMQALILTGLYFAQRGSGPATKSQPQATEPG